MTKKNIFQEALADAKELKKAAQATAEAVILEQVRGRVNKFVENQLNEMGSETEKELEAVEDVKEASEEEGEVCEAAKEDKDMDKEDDLDLKDVVDSEEEETDENKEEETVEEASGLTEQDLEEALREALGETLEEVTHGSLSDPEEVSPDKHDSGLLDVDSKEAGLETKNPPDAEDHTVKEVAALRKKVATLVKENVLLRKANAQLKESVNEVKLFNTKLFYVSKLLQKEGLKADAKAKIISKVDNAESVNEVKSIYESIEMALGLVSETKASKKPSSSLTEALGSGTSGAAKGVSQEKQQLDESVRRYQVLAGILKE